MSVEGFEANAEYSLKALACELRNGHYKPAPVRRVNIPKGQGKTRPLGIATVKDRIVQGALKLVMEPTSTFYGEVVLHIAVRNTMHYWICSRHN